MKGPALKQEKNGHEERTMISKTFCIARMIVLASFVLSPLHDFDLAGARK
jgi:hypothetical protein